MSTTTPIQETSEKAREYRTDIDGLRALAILLVVVYHVWLGRVSGGVDVFLMISAFFLTASFVRRIDRGSPMKLGVFWLRRFRRLLPAAAVTILAVLAVAFAIYPQTEWPRVWREAWASLFYSENWALAFSEVDYYARDAVTPSPFQHFWSLSVQGQVFLLWPLIIAGVALLCRRRPRSTVPVLFAVFAVIFAASLAFSIYETTSSQAFAYFDTRTRLWEFAAGSLVAIALPFIRLPAVVRSVLGWIGVAGIVVCGIVLDVQGGFPGYLALWPVLCTALVIVAGRQSAPGGPGRILSSKPFRIIGRDAYALYLVHWPILVTWMVVTERSQPSWLSGLGIIALSFALARLVSWGVESPLRRAAVLDLSWWRGGLVVVGAVLVVAAPLTVWQVAESARAASVEAAEPSGYPGAAQIDSPEKLEKDLPLRPLPTVLDGEWVNFGERCSETLAPAAPILEGSCLQNGAAAHDASPLILVIGDSHAQQLSAPLQELSTQEGWGLAALLKGGCSIGAAPPSAGGSLCEEWRRAALDYALDLKPNAVYLVTTRAAPGGIEVVIEGIDREIDELTRAGIAVIGVRDNPRFSFDMYECVAAAQGPCDVGQPPADEASIAAIEQSIIPVDFSPWFCPEGVCPGVIGNIAVYIDDNHISATYGRTLAPMLARALDAHGFPTDLDGGDR